MEGLFDFLANYYYIFAGISVFFLFALIGLIYESKKKKKDEKKTADAVAQPAIVAQNNEKKSDVVVATPTPQNQTQNNVQTAPTLEGLEADNSNFVQEDFSQKEPETLVIPDNIGSSEATPSVEPTLVIEDTPAMPMSQPSLIIEDKSAQQPKTMGTPGQEPM